MSPMLITILAFVTVTGVMAAVLFMGTAKSPVEQRLKKMLPDGAPEAAEARKAHEGSLIKTALAALGNYGVGGGDSGLSRKLSTAGVRGPNEQPIRVEVILHTRFTRCSGPLALGDLPEGRWRVLSAAERAAMIAASQGR